MRPSRRRSKCKRRSMQRPQRLCTNRSSSSSGDRSTSSSNAMAIITAHSSSGSRQQQYEEEQYSQYGYQRQRQRGSYHSNDDYYSQQQQQQDESAAWAEDDSTYYNDQGYGDQHDQRQTPRRTPMSVRWAEATPSSRSIRPRHQPLSPLRCAQSSVRASCCCRPVHAG